MNLARTMQRASAALVVVALTASVATPAVAKPVGGGGEPRGSKVKNIIVMISDGMGYNQMLAGDYYLYGQAGRSFTGMPFKSAMSTYALGDSYDPAAAWASFDYVKQNPTDSSAAATAMSTGMKTYNGAIGVDVDGHPIEHMMQAAEAEGRATGVVTSVEFSHATPAGFVAHNVSRNNYVAIADEMVRSSATDVIMGAGSPWYYDSGAARSAASYKYIGLDAWNALATGTPCADADGDGTGDAWTLVQSRDEFLALAEGETPERVCGVPQVYTTLQQARPGDGSAPAYAVPFTPGVPTLTEMTEGALNVLDSDEDGFVLMIEGGAVDWAGHANQSGRLIEEQADFVAAYQAVNAWVEENSNWGETLLIVTGDHETGYLTGPGSGQFASGPVWTPVGNLGVATMPAVQWNSGDHTNSLIPFFAKGSAARQFKVESDEIDPVRGRYIDNTEIAALCFKLLGQ
jgi:alkaline phosphatase